MVKRLFSSCVLLCCLAACASGRQLNEGAQLLQDVTLAPNTLAPARVLSPTPSPTVAPISTSELITPLELVTVKAAVTFVTPTLQPSPTATASPTATLSPTPTHVPTTTLLLIYSASTTPLAAPLAGRCTVTWFFSRTLTPHCPSGPALMSQASFQLFQQGYMIWVQQSRAIYVFYETPGLPRWQVFPDVFQDGMPNRDPAFDNAPSNTWQPQRGFGLLWRTRLDIRQRVGWAITDSETAYTVQIQIASDGAIYMSEPGGSVFALTSDGSVWARYTV